MLGRNYRFSAFNESGASSDVTVKARPWKFNSSGALVWGAEVTVLATATLADDGFTTGTAQDNSTDAYIGADLTITTTGAGTAGVVTIFLERSTDGGTTWPSAQGGIPVGAADAGDTVSAAA